METFHGSITTTGTSEAIRLEKPFFRNHPEFKQKSKVQAHVIAPGTILVSVLETPLPSEDDDPLVAAFLGFLEKDIEKHPSRLKPFTEDEISELRSLTAGVVVDDNEDLPVDIL